jgi:hypothetical protein
LGIARGSTNAATGSCPALSDVALPPGSYALTANYPSDGNYQRSVSSAQPLTVTTTLLTTGAFPQPAATCGDPGGAAFICALYQAALGRTADPSGLSIYQAQLTAGTSRRAVAEELLTSTEYRRDLVASYYQQYLGRPADAGGIATFVNMFTQGADAESVQAAIIASAEFADRSGGSDSGFVAALYQDLLNRPVDAGGLATFAEQLATGISRTAVAEELLTSADTVATWSPRTTSPISAARPPAGASPHSWLSSPRVPATTPCRPPSWAPGKFYTESNYVTHAMQVPHRTMAMASAAPGLL